MTTRSFPGQVAAVVPAHQAARFLGDALRSIAAQRPPVAETVVVDDGSTDDTAEVARAEPGVRLLRQAQQGISAARNAGASAVSSEWIAFLDADDLWLEGKLERQLAAIATSPGVDGVFTRLRNEYTDPELARRYQAVAGEPVGRHASTLLIRRSAFLATGGFDVSLRLGEFMDWYSRATHLGLRFEVVDEVLVVRRVHGDNTTLRRSHDSSGYVEAARRAIARRRAGATGKRSDDPS